MKQEERELWRNLPPKTRRYAKELLDNVVFNDGKAYSTETGEEVTHLVYNGLRTTEEQVRGLQAIDELTAHQKDNGGFIFAFFKQLTTIKERFPSLSKQDTARLMYIGTMIAWESGRLQSANGRKHYVKKDLEKLVDMSTKRFNEFYRKLVNEKIIEETETGELFMNPTVFYRGDLKKHDYDISDLEYTRLFRKTVRELYAEFKGRRLAQLAVIYSVLPFLNLNYNVVCHNPDESSDELVKPMVLGELTKLLGYSNTTTLRQTLNRIKIDGKPVFGFFENSHDRRTERIIVNPRVVFAGNNESLQAIKVLFN